MGILKRSLRRAVAAMLIFAAASGHSAARAEPVRRVETEQKRVAVTFDDGPSDEKTREILEILEEYGVKATFFVIGKNAEAHPDRVREIHEAGHEIGNHTWSHRYLTKMNADEIREELGKTEAVLTGICGEKPVVFRPPGGYWSEESVGVVESMGYQCVLWSVDTRDWTMAPAARIIREVEKNTGAGDIILFHDLADKRLNTPEALRTLLPSLKEQGV